MVKLKCPKCGTENKHYDIMCRKCGRFFYPYDRFGSKEPFDAYTPSKERPKRTVNQTSYKAPPQKSSSTDDKVAFLCCGTVFVLFLILMFSYTL